MKQTFEIEENDGTGEPPNAEPQGCQYSLTDRLLMVGFGLSFLGVLSFLDWTVWDALSAVYRLGLYLFSQFI